MPARAQTRRDPIARIRSYLRSLPVDELAEWVLALRVERDGGWRALDAEVRMATGELDIPDQKKRITWALQFHGYPRWMDQDRVLDRIGYVIERLWEIAAAGHAAHVVTLAEHAAIRLDEAIAHTDLEGLPSEVFTEIERLHLEAARQAPPDSAPLGGRLAKLAVATHRGWFRDAAVTYADLLGEAGLAAYRKRIERELRHFGPCGPGDAPWTEPGYRRRIRVADARLQLARVAGDVEELVRVLAHDLSRPRAFVRIAAELDAVGREREGLAWLERGYAAFGDGERDDLAAALSAAYRRDGQIEDAARVEAAAAVAHRLVRQRAS